MNSHEIRAEMQRRFDVVKKNDADMPAAVKIMFEVASELVEKHTQDDSPKARVVKCELCSDTGVMTVVTSPPHIKPVRHKEIMCTQGCNRAAVEENLELSRQLMQEASDQASKLARNPPMPKGWPNAQDDYPEPGMWPRKM